MYIVIFTVLLGFCLIYFLLSWSEFGNKFLIYCELRINWFSTLVFIESEVFGWLMIGDGTERCTALTIRTGFWYVTCFDNESKYFVVLIIDSGWGGGGGCCLVDKSFHEHL